MKEKTYEQVILSSVVGECSAEDHYVTPDHLDMYEHVVTRVQEKYGLNRKAADSKAQQLIKAYQDKTSRSM